MDRLYLCKACIDRIIKNGGQVTVLREIENSDDYECDLNGCYGKLYECIVTEKD